MHNNKNLSIGISPNISSLNLNLKSYFRVGNYVQHQFRQASARKYDILKWSAPKEWAESWEKEYSDPDAIYEKHRKQF